jgi:hypothetical protein
MQMRRGLALVACSGALLWAGVAPAQSWVLDAHAGLKTGLEGADTGNGVEWQRARTRLVLGLDLGSDESHWTTVGIRAFVELERSVSVGAELGLMHWFTPTLGGFIGGVAVFTPETLVGGTANLIYVFPLGERLGLFLDGSISALPLGSDRPGDGTVLWLLLGIGVRGQL